MNRQDRIVSLVFVLLFAVIIAVGFTGCGTVVPKSVAAETASFDGNEQTSGILSSSPAGFVVTGHFRDRYNALVKVYGHEFTVPLKRDEGVTRMDGGRWLIDREHMTKFLEMNALSRAGINPKNKP